MSQYYIELPQDSSCVQNCITIFYY